ncbi:MAG: hypothetical protein ACR2MP_12975 [Streptosporangiaceae bacterium]
MSDKDVHEDAALQALVDQLNSRGRRAAIVSRPDRDGSSLAGLTVDATVRIDGQDWAVDHCLLSRPPDLPGALAAATTALQPRLDAVAQQYQCGLAVSYLPQSTSQHSKKEIGAYYDEVVATAERAAQAKMFAGGADENMAADHFPSTPPVAHLMPFTDTIGSPRMSDQVDAGLTATLAKKLTGQLARAKNLGFPVALLIDQVPRPGKQSTVVSASPMLIARVVQQSLNAHPDVVDQVWLRPLLTAPPYLSPRVHLLIA